MTRRYLIVVVETTTGFSTYAGEESDRFPPEFAAYVDGVLLSQGERFA